MNTSNKHGLEELLAAFNRKETGALEQLIEHSYDMLNKTAASLLNGDRQARYLSSQDLVHIVYENLQRQNQPILNFQAYAKEMMRTAIKQNLRKQSRLKRGGTDAEHICIHSFEGEFKGGDN